MYRFVGLDKLSDELIRSLRKHPPLVVADISPCVHLLPPIFPDDDEDLWRRIQREVEVCEFRYPRNGYMDPERWCSLRLRFDFWKLAPLLKKLGLVRPAEIDKSYADLMKSVARKLLENYSGKIAFTQFDEILLIIPPGTISWAGDQQQNHPAWARRAPAGQIMETCTLAASRTTAIFNAEFRRLFLERTVHPDENAIDFFECSLGSYNIWQEVRAMLLWRGHVCSRQGIDVAMVLADERNAPVESIRDRPVEDKLRWLARGGLLPLPRHMAQGCYLVRVGRVYEVYDEARRQRVRNHAVFIEDVDRPIHELALHNDLLPQDDAPLAPM